MKRLILLLLLLTSCSPEKLLQMAVKKGAKVQTDTVFQDVITERTITDTVTRFQTVNRIFTDTITTETIRWKSRLRIDTLTRTIFQQVECKPDTIRVAAAFNQDISAGFTTWQLIGSTLGGILFALAMCYGAYKIAGLVQKASKSS